VQFFAGTLHIGIPEKKEERSCASNNNLKFANVLLATMSASDRSTDADMEFAEAGMQSMQMYDSQGHALPIDFAYKKDDEVEILCCCCKKIGKLHVLCEAPNHPGKPRNLYCVVGPYWTMMLCCTTPLILVPCFFGAMFMATRVHPAVTVLFCSMALFTLGSLWKTATTDPGLVLRRAENPADEGNARDKKKWAWDDRTKSWRSITARYAADCNVLVDEYDHTCPWTGTAIGRGNIFYFYMFTGSLLPLVIFLVVGVFVALANESNDDDI